MTESPRPVLVGIDGTPSGLQALALGEALAVLTGAPLLLAAVYGHQGGTFSDLIWPTAAEARGWLEQASQRLGDLVPWHTETMVSSSPAHGLVELAELERAQLVVLGWDRHGPLGRLMAGSTVRGVVHGSPCPVAVAPHDWRPRSPEAPLTFGVAVDDGTEAHEALLLAGALAAAARAPLRAITVVPAPEQHLYAASVTGTEPSSQDGLQQGRTVARAAIAAARPEVVPELTVMAGEPVECLQRASHDLDLLVVGSRRFGGVRRALLGSVSSPLIAHAACPVVIVPRGARGAVPPAAVPQSV